MQPLVTHCRASLAKLYRSTCDPRAAESHFAIASALFREMGMTSPAVCARPKTRRRGVPGVPHVVESIAHAVMVLSLTFWGRVRIRFNVECPGSSCARSSFG